MVQRVKPEIYGRADSLCQLSGSPFVSSLPGEGSIQPVRHLTQEKRFDVRSQLIG
jgi:hypothetical protein